MTETHCTGCGSARVHRSRRRLPLEYAIVLAGGQTTRCHACNTRFIQFGQSLFRADRLMTLSKRLGVAALTAAAIGVLVAAILWVSHNEAPAGPPEAPAVSAAPHAAIDG